MNNENEFNNNEPEETLDDANVIPEAETTEEIIEEVSSEESIMTSELGDEGIMTIAEGTPATSTATCSPSSLSVSKNNTPTGTISWSLPSLPDGIVINACELTGTPSISNSKVSATVNGTKVTSGTKFTISLGTSNNTTTASVTTSVTGNASGTVEFNNLVYTVYYSLAYTVTFVDWDGTVLKTETVKEGSSATAPNPTRDGYRFTGWDVSFNNVTSDLTVTAQYVEAVYYTVTFVDWDGTVLKTEQVEEETSATAPSNPTRTGYRFTGWDKDFSSITSDLTVTAQYTEVEKYLIARYTANASGVVPIFNSGYTYEVSETENNGIYTVEITSDTDFTSCSFKSKTGLLTVEYLKITNAVTSMYEMFYGCTSLTLINGMANWDTSNVTNMSNMFRNCNNLTSLDVSNFNTSNVTTMRYMFGSCESVTSIDVSNFNTSSVTDMGCMFSYCTSLTELDVSNFNTSSVTDMISMFHTCSKLTQLDVSNFNTSNVTDMYSMFNNCQSLTGLDLSNFNTSNVTDMTYMFQFCYNLTSISMNNSDYNSINKIISALPTRTTDSMGTLNVVGVDDFSQVDTTTASSKYWNVVDKLLVAKYTANTAGVVPTFNDGYTYELTETENNGVYTVEITSDSDFSSIDFKSKTGLTTVEYLKITNVITSMYQLFYGCTLLTSINGISDWDISNVTNMHYMFRNCYSLTTIDLSNFNTNNVTDMGSMFSGCNNLTQLDVSNFNTTNVIDMSYMFQNCTNLTQLDVSNFNTSNATTMQGMFRGTNLTSIDVNNFNTSNVTTMNNMFYNCNNLTQLDASNFNTSNVTNMGSMFYDCTNLTELNISNWDLNKVSSTSYMLDSCTNLTSILMNNSDYNSINKIISVLPTRTTDSMGTLNVAGVDDISQVDTATAESKFWNVVEEPVEDVIEWTGVGTVATGLNSGIKHSNYKINLDWDNEYFDIILQNYTYTDNGDAGTNVCSVRINNNTYDYYFFEGNIALVQGSENIYEWTPNVIPHTLRFAKDGIYCLYGEENAKIGEIEYNNDDVIYILEDDQYNTDFNIDFDLVVSERPNEEPEEEVIEWTGIGTVVTNLSTEDDWTYKLNIDWDTQYVEINNIVAGISAFSHGADVLYLNNEYDLSTGDLISCDETCMLIIDSKNDYGIDFWTEEFSIKISKDNGFTLSDDSNGESFTIENYPLIEDSSTLYLSSLVCSNDGYSTIGEIKVVAIESEEPDNNELIQGGINDESGAFEDETTNVVKTNYIDVSDKKQIIVNVLTDDVYIVKCYLYNANKELVKIIDISADKKRMFGLDLQKLIEEVMDNGNE